MLRTFKAFANQGPYYGWKTLQKYRWAKFVAHSGIQYHQLEGKEPVEVAQIVKDFYLKREDGLFDPHQKFPTDTLHLITTGEFGLGGVYHEGMPERDGDKATPEWTWQGEKAHPETYIPAITKALQEVCQQLEAEHPGQHFCVSVNNVFYHLKNGEKIAVNHEGEEKFLASNITILATSTEAALFDKSEASREDAMGSYVLRTQYEALRAPVKDKIEKKIFEFKGQKDGIRAVLVVTCLDAIKHHDTEMRNIDPGGILVLLNAAGTPQVKDWNFERSLGKCLVFIADSMAISNTGLYEVVGEGWNLIKTDTKAGQGFQLRSGIGALFKFISPDIMTKRTAGGMKVEEHQALGKLQRTKGKDWVYSTKLIEFTGDLELDKDGTIPDPKLKYEPEGRIAQPRETLPESKSPELTDSLKPDIDRNDHSGKLERDERLDHAGKTQPRSGGGKIK